MHNLYTQPGKLPFPAVGSPLPPRTPTLSGLLLVGAHPDVQQLQSDFRVRALITPREKYGKVRLSRKLERNPLRAKWQGCHTVDPKSRTLEPDYTAPHAWDSV